MNRLLTWDTSCKSVKCHILSQRNPCIRSFLPELHNHGGFCHRESSNLNFGFKTWFNSCFERICLWLILVSLKSMQLCKCSLRSCLLVKQFLAAYFEKNCIKKKKKSLVEKTNQLKKTNPCKRATVQWIFQEDEGIVPLDFCLFVHTRNLGISG